ncbi:restriction endonuclease [Xanthobacter autotrophicus]|uniref:restriction endonuclease n=1 Tax=Xanthobacter autotrophicus TaxID=280 RepID=UPI00372B72FD
MSMTDWVKDWGGFEKLVAKLNETGEVMVQHNVVLTGRSGAPRQIDVLIRHKQGLYEHLVIAECKYWNSPIERLHIDALTTTVREVGASRGVIFSSKGFQSGALAQAAHDNIDLFLVRDLSPEEWGLPGRVVDLFLQIIVPSIGNINLPGVLAYGTVDACTPVALNMEFGSDGPISVTPFLAKNKTDTLEQRLHNAAQQALTEFTTKYFTINGGEECTRYMVGHINVQPESPFLIPRGTIILYIPRIEFDLGIKISQSRITIDRAQNYLFALAVENCITGICSSASRPLEADRTTITEINPEKNSEGAEGEEPLRNGSILRVYLKGFFPFQEMDGLARMDPVFSPPNPYTAPSAVPAAVKRENDSDA